MKSLGWEILCWEDKACAERRLVVQGDTKAQAAKAARMKGWATLEFSADAWICPECAAARRLLLAEREAAGLLH